MADLPEEYWATLGPSGPFLRAVFMAQKDQLQQLLQQHDQMTNHLMGSQDDLVNAASTAAVAAAQQFVTPPPPPTFLSAPSTNRSVKAADPDKFSGDRGETEGFIRALKLAVAVRPGSFPDERTKLLYALSFMTGGSAQIWAHNETEAILNGTSSIMTFEDFTKRVEEAFGDPDRASTARTKLHNLKMTSNMSADEYTAQFEILAGRTGFNDAALEDAYIRGLPATILDKIHSQPSLPTNLKAWKESTCQIDRNYRRLLEIKRAQAPHISSRPTPFRPTPSRIHSSPAPAAPITAAPAETSVPMDIDSNRRRTETRTCYNCGRKGHISPHCPDPPKRRIRTNFTEVDIKGMISESVAAALDAHKPVPTSEEATEEKKEGKGF
jgi:Retrotransposon gag protein/Zinc knuckle